MFKESPSLVLIRQPPSPFFRKHTGGESTFLNTTEEGAWYGLSTDRYPLLSSRVRPAPWVFETDKDRNATKEDLVGIHPILRTLDVNIDNSGLPAPYVPPSIDAGEWQNKDHSAGLLKEGRLLLLALLGIFFLLFWKRRFLSNLAFGRSFTIKNTVENPQDAVVLEKAPEEVGEAQETVAIEAAGDVDSQEIDEAVPVLEKKRRKRGQRGGRNNKRKVGFAEPTTDIDEDELGQNKNEPNHGMLAKGIPKESPVNDQGDLPIDGLVITDRLLGIQSHFNF